MDVGATSESYDATTLRMLQARLVAVVDEAAAVLQRTAFSTVLSEANRFAVALLDTQGNLVAQSTVGLPVLAAMMPGFCRSLLDTSFPAETWQTGDVVIANDPYLCAGYKAAVGLLAPVFRTQSSGSSTLTGFVACVAHLADMGGVIWGMGARNVYEEGLLVPPTKLYDAGKSNDLLLSFIRANVRAGQQTVGDIRAQVAAAERGIRSLMRLMDDHKLNDLQALATQLMQTAERAMREAIRKAPDGQYHYYYQADGDGLAEPVHLNCLLTIQGDEIVVNYEGTSGPHTMAINAVADYVYASTAYPIQCVFCPDGLINEGTFRPIRVMVPDHSLLNAGGAVPVGACSLTGGQLSAPILGALAQAVPDLVQADSGSSIWSVVLNGDKEAFVEKPERMSARKMAFVEYLILNGGSGARPHQNGIHTLGFPPNGANVPTEVVERNAPVLVLEKSLRPETGGTGAFRGGAGQTVHFRVVGQNPVAASIVTEKRASVPHGLLGGEAGSQGEQTIAPRRVLPSDGLTKLQSGDELTLKLPGGGGFGTQKSI